MDGKRHVVKVVGGGAKIEEGEGGRKLLRIWITAEVDGVRREYEITYGRYEKNTAKGFAYASANAPGGREADAERLAAVVEALTGRKAEDTQKERRHHRDRMRQRAPRRLHAFTPNLQRP